MAEPEKLKPKTIELHHIDPETMRTLIDAVESVISTEPQPLLGDEGYGDENAEEAEGIVNGTFRSVDLDTSSPDAMRITFASYLPERRVTMGEDLKNAFGLEIANPTGHIGFSCTTTEASFRGAIYLTDDRAIVSAECAVPNPDDKLSDDGFTCYNFAEALGLADVWARFIYGEPAAATISKGMESLAIQRLTQTVGVLETQGY